MCLETRTVKISKPMHGVPTAQSQNSDDTVPFLGPADPNSHQQDKGRKTRLSQTKRSRTSPPCSLLSVRSVDQQHLLEPVRNADSQAPGLLMQNLLSDKVLDGSSTCLPLPQHAHPLSVSSHLLTASGASFRIS